MPPGFSTRRNSESALSSRGKKKIANPQSTRSNESSGNSIASASILCISAFIRPRRAISPDASLTIESAMSMPTTLPWDPARFAAGNRLAPRPAATSRTCAPDRISACSAMRRPISTKNGTSTPHPGSASSLNRSATRCFLALLPGIRLKASNAGLVEVPALHDAGVAEDIAGLVADGVHRPAMENTLEFQSGLLQNSS